MAFLKDGQVRRACTRQTAGVKRPRRACRTIAARRIGWGAATALVLGAVPAHAAETAAPVTSAETAAPVTRAAAPAETAAPVTSAATPAETAAPVTSAVPPAERAAPQAEPGSPPERNPWLGGLGFATTGIIMGNFGEMDAALRADDALGPDVGVGPVAVTLGGGGGVLLAGRWMLRGKGFGMFVPSSPNARGRVQLSGGGGGFDLGMVLYNRRRWLLYPYFGVGGMGMSLEVANRTSNALSVGGRSIESDQRRTFGTGFATVELGLAFHREVFGRRDPGATGHGGFIHGGEIGVMTSVAGGRWDDDGVDVAMAGGQVLGPYLRLNFGGGGFWLGGSPLQSRSRKRR